MGVILEYPLRRERSQPVELDRVRSDSPLPLPRAMRDERDPPRRRRTAAVSEVVSSSLAVPFTAAAVYLKAMDTLQRFLAYAGDFVSNM